MSEGRPSLDKLEGGDIISFDNMSHVAAFEDLLADHIDPQMTANMHNAWQGRVAIRELLRVPDFNGRLANITMAVMEEPYERRLDARERGWKLPARTPPSAHPEVIDSYHGFSFFAEAKSSGRGRIGQIQAEMWYYAAPRYVGRESGFRYSKKLVGGASVGRLVTLPRFEKRAFVELQEEARRIAFLALQQGKAHSIIQPKQS